MKIEKFDYKELKGLDMATLKDRSTFVLKQLFEYKIAGAMGPNKDSMNKRVLKANYAKLQTAIANCVAKGNEK